MTNLTTRVMIAAATVVVAAGTASAQNLKAEIPFSFRAGYKMMAAGTYQVSNLSTQSGVPLFKLATAEGRGTILLLPRGASDAKKNWEQAGNPLLRFECANANCFLAGVWTGPGTPQYDFPHPKMGVEGPFRVATVALRPERGE
jgi:hypothetical protein